MNPGSSCSPALISQARAEARRELKALLVLSGVAGALTVAIGRWRGPGALWPVWGTIGATTLVALALGTWAAYLRDWRALRTDKLRATARGETREGAGVQADSA